LDYNSDLLGFSEKPERIAIFSFLWAWHFSQEKLKKLKIMDGLVQSSNHF
jgi:hypothetical protein